MSKYVRDEAHCKHESYIKEDIDELFYKKENYAILTGSITLTANTEENVASNTMIQTTKELDYPEGFTMDNCVVVSLGAKRTTLTGYNYGYLPESFNSTGMLTGLLPEYIKLDENTIKVVMWNLATSELTFDYKIVLMKVE